MDAQQLFLLEYALYNSPEMLQEYVARIKEEEIKLHAVYPQAGDSVKPDFIFIGGIIDGGLYYSLL